MLDDLVPPCLANEQSIPAMNYEWIFGVRARVKDPYTRTAVSDYNASYNVTLYSFFINATMTIDKMAYVTRLWKEPMTS